MSVEDAKRDDAYWRDVEQFLIDVVPLGARLYAIEDREYAQSIATVWASRLYRATRREQWEPLDRYDPDCPDPIAPIKAIKLRNEPHNFEIIVELWENDQVRIRRQLGGVVVMNKRDIPAMIKALREVVRA